MPGPALASMSLARLIQDHRDRTGDSYDKIAKRGGMSKSVVAYLATTPIKSMPEQKNLEGLAKGLGVDLGVVTRAAQKACGYTVEVDTLPDDPDTEMIIAHLGELDDAQKQSIKALVQHYVDQNNL